MHINDQTAILTSIQHPVLAVLVWAEIEYTMHAALPKQPINQFRKQVPGLTVLINILLFLTSLTRNCCRLSNKFLKFIAVYRLRQQDRWNSVGPMTPPIFAVIEAEPSIDTGLSKFLEFPPVLPFSVQPIAPFSSFIFCRSF